MFESYRNVKDYGAVGDGITNDTQAIQRAVDDGGIAYFPPGTYLTGTIRLRSHGGLHLDYGAVIQASADFDDYNAPDVCPQNWVSKNEYANGKHLILAIEEEDISLTGGGIIDGRSSNWFTEVSDRYKGTIYENYKPPQWRPSQMVCFFECRNIRISDLEFRNSPYWTIFLHGGREANIHHIRIRSDRRGHNGDGIDIDSCSNVIISDCDIDTSDDSITLRSCSRLLKNHTDCENIAVSNCLLRSGQAGIRVGLGNGTRIRYATFSNLVIHGKMGIVIDASWERDPGAKISDIHFSNIQMAAIRPFNITDTLRCPDAVGYVRDVTFSHIRAIGEYPSGVTASQPGRVKGIRFFDLVLDYPDKAGAGAWDNLAKAGTTVFFAKNVQDMLFDNVVIRRHATWTEAFRSEDCEDIRLQNCRLDEPSEVPEIDQWCTDYGGLCFNCYR